jgi:hypothetical protein
MNTKINGIMGLVLAASRQVTFCAVTASMVVWAADRPTVTRPRATAGDSAIEPEWNQRLTVTVGHSDADIVGTNGRAVQAAADYVARLGGGTVQLRPGTYRLRNAVFLQSKVRLFGSGEQTVLVKEPCRTTQLAEDSDWYDQEITLADPEGFEIGDGVCLRARSEVVKRTLVARSGNRFKLDRALRENFWRNAQATVSTLFPIVSGECVTDIAIENLTLDGNRTNNLNLDGNYAGCIWLQDCARVLIRGVTARNYNGDGISWQICHDVTVENCVSVGNTGLGLHPGSGSQRPVMRNNRVADNDIGLFFCWGVKYGLAEQNILENNRVGISIGHRDTDNVVARNEILRSREVGILFRPEGGKDFAGHRNRLEENRIVDSGGTNGVAVDVQGGTEGILLRGNRIEETRGASSRIGVRLGADTRGIELETNHITGFAIPVHGLGSTVGSVSSVRVVMPGEPGAIARRAADILRRQITERCAATVVSAGQAALAVELGIEPGFGTEGYRIADGPGGSVRILGNDERGLLYGVGKFLRSSRYDLGGFTPGAWRGTSVPQSPMRGIYLATHFNNYYEAASSEELERYVEDLALWGFNLVALAYPHWQYSGYDDPAALAMTERLRRTMRVAKHVGMRVSIGDALNGSFTSTPPDLRCTPVPDPLGRHGNFGVNLCPSKPAAREKLIREWGQLLDRFADPGPDCVTYWPYDEGGCGCSDCWPWGARGYLALARAVSGLVRQRSPNVQVILSTWTFDTPPVGEWEALSQALAQDKTWANFIQADAHEDFPRFPLDRGVPGGLPLISFPEISMWGQNPWGGYGANPLPVRLQRLWDQTQRKLAGGTPYSEGIYEDINKAICAQFYWDAQRPAIETVREYTAFEFSPAVADDLVRVVEILEKNHLRAQIGPSAAEALVRVQSIDTRLTPQARAAWRWRVVYLRALIDSELLKTHGKLEGKVLQEAFRELTALYHAEHSHSMPIRPPKIGDTPAK